MYLYNIESLEIEEVLFKDVTTPKRCNIHMSFLPAWVVRAFSTYTLVLVLIAAFFFANMFVIYVCTANYRSNTPFTMHLTRQMAERTGLCDPVDLGNPSRYNSTVLAVCRAIRRDEARVYRKRQKKVNPYPHKFLIEGEGICKPSTTTIVLVHSLHDYVDRRDAIRRTWGGAVTSETWPSYKKGAVKGVRVGFVLGYNRNQTWNDLVIDEAKHNRDIIMGDFIDDYRNMTLKSLLGLKWVLNYCPSATYLVKSDDDMIINFPYLLDILHSANMTRAIMGPYNLGSKVLRRGKWAISFTQFPFLYYPAYESGACYVISGDLIRDIYETSEYVPWIFIDDVYITGILGKIVGAVHLRRDGFAFWSSKVPKPCDLKKNRIITGTKVRAKALLNLWKGIKRAKCLDSTEHGKKRAFG